MLGCLVALASLLLLSGCAELGLGGSGQELAATETTTEPVLENQPYYPTEFKDLLIPSELTWNRQKSMVIKTDSFAGGVLNFSGRVDVNSLSDFFVKTMEKNNWKLAGSVKYRQVLLAFIKPNKTCTIVIADNDFGITTGVHIYITQDLANSTGATMPGAGGPY